MRTTVTLDSDTEASLRRVMAERGVSFKQALNDAVRIGTRTASAAVTPTRPRDLGSLVNLDKALRIAGELEDQEILAKLALGR